MRIEIRFTNEDAKHPPMKLSDVELHFVDDAGMLTGLKLIGFGLWQSRSLAGGFNVTFPARTYAVNGERRSFALLRPRADVAASNALRDRIIAAWHAHQGTTAGEPDPRAALTHDMNQRTACDYGKTSAARLSHDYNRITCPDCRRNIDQDDAERHAERKAARVPAGWASV